MESSKSKMIYRKLGNTGLNVSILSYGTWITAEDPKKEADIIECMKKAWELGVNFFDTAEIYNEGCAETIMGKGLKEINAPREEIVITTKLMHCGKGPNDSLLSRKHLIEGLKNSLKRMQVDYVDVLFCHRPDCYTTMEETVRTMDWIVEEGYAFYWATSEWSAADIAKAMEICKKEGLNKPIADQCHYNALYRDNFEKNLRHSFENYNYGTTIWSPLASGLLTGKYNQGSIPEGSRMATDYGKSDCWPEYCGPKDEKKEKVFDSLTKLEEIAKEVGCTQAQLMLAWCLVTKDVSTCIFGATKVSQVEDNMGALEVATKWTQELEDKIGEALGNMPEPEMDFNTWTPKRPRRQVTLDTEMTLE